MSTSNTEFYLNMLKTNVCEVTLNINGSDLVVNLTLKDELVKLKLAPQNTNNGTIYCWDIDNKTWFALTLDKVKSFKLMPGISNLTVDPTARIAKSVYAQVLDTQPSAIAPEILQNYKVPTADGKRKFYLEMLHNGPCEVKFTKADGSERTMKATLEQSKIAELGLTPTKSASPQPSINLDVIKVVDFEAKGWRTFRIDSVKSFTLLKGYGEGVAPVATDNWSVSLQMRKDLTIQALREGICDISFTKADNTVRNMKATLNADLIDQWFLQPSKRIDATTLTNPDLIKVVDTDLKEWRTFKLSSLLTFNPQVVQVVKRRTTLSAI